MPGVIQLHPYPTITIARRDLTETVLEVRAAERFTDDVLVDTGYERCGRCGVWCEPVELDREVACGICTVRALQSALERGLRGHENARELSRRVYSLMVGPAPEPPPLRAS